MPLVDIHPISTEVEEELNEVIPLVRARIKEVIAEFSGFPESDVIVNLHRCSVRSADPDAAQIVVLIDTNPNEELEVAANFLRDALARTFIELVLTDSRNVEIWLRFLPGSWCMVRNDEIVDKVDITLWYD